MITKGHVDAETYVIANLKTDAIRQVYLGRLVKWSNVHRPQPIGQSIPFFGKQRLVERYSHDPNHIVTDGFLRSSQPLLPLPPIIGNTLKPS